MARGTNESTYNAFAAAFGDFAQQAGPNEPQPGSNDRGDENEPANEEDENEPANEEDENQSQDGIEDAQSPQAGERLQRLRAGFNTQGVRKKAKAADTFTKRQKHNERFILYLYLNQDKHAYLNTDLLHDLVDTDTDPDYSDITSQHQLYKRRGGKKSLEERIQEVRFKRLRDRISWALNEPGLPPRGPTVNLEALEHNVDVFIDFLTDSRLEDGGIMKPKTYAGLRSSLTYLFRRYKYTTSRNFELEIKDCMEGVKRYSNEANQEGEGNIWDGDRPLTWELYEQFNKWFLADGTADGIFACAFAKMTCNLACRGKSTGQVCLKHIKWEGDCMAIPFAHSKDSQCGTNLLKKLPRHCYSNPLNIDSDLPSAMFHFMALNTDVVANPQESFFKGSLKSQSQTFGRYVRKICLRYKTVIEKEYGFNIYDIGVHSWRKCAHTKLNTGSTSGPSGAAACLRGGHAIGGSKDLYIAQEKASDTYCGRILQGLPEHSPEFAVSYPDFVPIEAIQSLTGGVSEEQYGRKQKEVNEMVTTALNSIFGEENLANNTTFKRILRVGLASHLYHFSTYDKLLDPEHPEKGKRLPDSSPLRCISLFTNPMISALREHVRVAMPWDDHYQFFAPATGVPPHVMIYSYLQGLSKKVDEVPTKIEEILDSRQMIGKLSLKQIAKAVEESQGPQLTAMANDISSLQTMVQDVLASVGSDGGGTSSNRRTVSRQNIRLVRQYKHADGKERRVPSSWKFPSLPLQNMYLYWHCGDEQRNIPPMKYLQCSDVDYLGKRARTSLSECRKVMTAIDREAERKGTRPRDIMTQVETNSCYYCGESAITSVVPSNTPEDRVRNVSRLKWGTVVKYMRKKRA